MVRVGIIGCGNIGGVHAMVLNEIEEVSLCALADIRNIQPVLQEERQRPMGP